jgi:hypothetical protein
MYARKWIDEHGKPFFDGIGQTPQYTKCYPGNDGNDRKIYAILVSIHENQEPERKARGFTTDYWGWLETGETSFDFVYPSFPQFSMCFAGGFEAEEERGRGKAYRLAVEEVGAIDERSIA